MSRFRESREFAPTLDAAAEQLNISPTAVEKDYWVSEILRVMSRDFHPDFIFKGGTSLSKGYRIVERFSEDIDVLIVPGKRSRGETDKLMKEMSATVAAAIGGDATPFGGAEKGRHRSYEIGYPATRGKTALVRTNVLLEMGIRGGHNPSEAVAIGCLMGDVLADNGVDLAEFVDLEPFDVVLLHPGRTLLEKLVHIHQATQQLGRDISLQPDHRSGRHFYDIYKLLGHAPVCDFLDDREEVDLVLTSIEEVTQKYFSKGIESDVRPEGGFAISEAFDVNSSISHRFRMVYEATMIDLYFGAVPLPTWESICERVAAARGRL